MIQCGPPGTTGTTVIFFIALFNILYLRHWTLKLKQKGRRIFVLYLPRRCLLLRWQAAVKTAAVDRLTDSAKYTGSHVSISSYFVSFQVYWKLIELCSPTWFDRECDLTRVGAVVELKVGKTSPTVPVTSKAMPIKILMTRAIRILGSIYNHIFVYPLIGCLKVFLFQYFFFSVPHIHF